jgi:transcriptional regulator with XRE-family HTH domain
MNEQEIVKKSLLDIFKRNGYADAGSMTQRHFEHIGEEIEKKSGILISGTTIKRLSNGEFSRLPQVATLNAIATYFDFKNWQEYKSSLALSEKPVKEEPKTKVAERRGKILVQLRWALLIIPVFAVGYYLYSTKRPIGNYDKAIFSAHKNTTNEIPNTVVFNYDIDNVNADSFFIQQSWDKNRRIRIYKNSHTVTDIYYEPGYHIAKLIANDSIIKTVDISIPTDKWVFYANEYKIRYNTEYIKTDSFIKNGSLVITPGELQNNKIGLDKDKVYIYSYFPTKLEVNSDDYTLKTRVRMKEIRNNFCPFIMLEVYCQRYFMMVKSTPRGCASEALVLFGENEMGGKKNDLVSIAYDVTQWTDVELVVKNKKVLIKINGKNCFTTSYTNSARLITGLSFISNGLCEVDKVELAGLDGKLVYKNDFGIK